MAQVIFTSFTRTVDKIKTVDRSVKLTNKTTKKIISNDHSITTTTNGVVTIDRTFEKFDLDGNVDLHDHFFNISSGDTVITGRNLTRLTNFRTKDVDFLESARKRDGELTISRSFVSFPMDNTPVNTSNVAIAIKANNLTEIYHRNTLMINDETIWKKVGSNATAIITEKGIQLIDFRFKKFNQDNEVSVSKQTQVELQTDNSIIIDTYTSSTNFLTSGFRLPEVEDHFILTIKADDQKTVDQYITTKRQLGDTYDIISFEMFNATIEADETVSKIQTNLRMDPSEHRLYLQEMIRKAKLRITTDLEEVIATSISMTNTVTTMTEMYQSIFRDIGTFNQILCQFTLKFSLRAVDS
ncbi:Protein of unknown function [Cotesia congregata]|uniref:Uncharacterized protein n=1 Tax=Cotesia congregata TaxID=51543 RepID=A0A8J2H755_COTCN|nr:Protein of unknown function [Cotesia congregata]